MLYFPCTQDLASNHAIQTENVICILMNMGETFILFLVFETNYSQRSLYCIHVVLLWYAILEAMSFISARKNNSFPQMQQLQISVSLGR
jgi:hypothetical protein